MSAKFDTRSKTESWVIPISRGLYVISERSKLKFAFNLTQSIPALIASRAFSTSYQVATSLYFSIAISRAPLMEAHSSLREYVEAQDRLDKEARALFPYDFSTCSYEMGHLKQQVFACRTCEPSNGETQHGGVCYSCSITCHGDHVLVELFNRRAFRCDCGSNRIGQQDCCIRKERIQVNNDNLYNQNFQNIFCFCQKEYNAETEDGTMYQCLLCEDWFHEQCIKNAESMPSEDSFEYLICRTCVEKEVWLLRYSNDPRFCWTMDEVDKNISHAESTGQSIPETPSTKRKSDLDDIHSSNKKTRTTSELSSPAVDHFEHSSNADLDQSDDSGHCAWESLPAQDFENDSLFLLEDFRTRLCRCDACQTHRLSSCPAIAVEEEVYDPPADEDDDNESSFDAGTRAMESTLQSMPRDKAIEGILAFNKLKDHIASCLKPLAESGEIITKDHVRKFFEER